MIDNSKNIGDKLSTRNYPDFVEQRMRQLNQRKSIPIPDIQNLYDEIFDGSEQRARTQFPSASAEALLIFRQRYAIGKVWTDLITRAKLGELDVIYCGHNGLRYARGSGKPYCNMFVVTQEPDRDNPGATKAILRRMVARGSLSDLYRSLSMFTRYKAKLGSFPGGLDLIIDNRTEFDMGTPVNLPIDTFNKILNIPNITVSQSVKYPSKRSGNWEVATDWRCIQGFVGGDPRTWVDKTDKKTQRGVCNIVDDTVEKEPEVDDSGNVISPGLTAWTAPEHLIYDDGSYCAFYGTVSAREDKKSGEMRASMNCYLIRPIFATQALEEDDL